MSSLIKLDETREYTARTHLRTLLNEESLQGPRSFLVSTSAHLTGFQHGLGQGTEKDTSY